MTFAGTTALSSEGPRRALGPDRDFLLAVVERLLSCTEGSRNHGGAFALSPTEIGILCKAARSVSAREGLTPSLLSVVIVVVVNPVIKGDSFSHQPGLLRLSPGLIIVGDIHGQYDDLLRVFKAHGPPSKTCYLFLGDYVDRGPDGLEVVCLLLAYHLLYPNNVHLIRGNHECCTLTLMYGFYAECLSKSGVEAWREVTDAFNHLPLAALIGEKIFCVHGGISPRLDSLEQINEIKRPAVIQHEISELLTDLVWSDPAPYVKGWQKNPRGAGYFFGINTVREFKQRHGLTAIVRSHEAQKKGYNVMGKSGLITVFSAPNYRSTGNTGATMMVSQDCTFRFRTFPPLDKDGEPLKTASRSSEEWAVGAAPAPAKPSQVEEGPPAQLPAYTSPFAAMSGMLPPDVPFGEALDASAVPHLPQTVASPRHQPSVAVFSPFSGVQFSPFDDPKPQAVSMGRSGSVVMPSPFALAQSGSLSLNSDECRPNQGSVSGSSSDCSARTGSGSSQQSETTCVTPHRVSDRVEQEEGIAPASSEGPAGVSAWPEASRDQGASGEPSALMYSPFAALSDAFPTVPADTATVLRSPFAVYGESNSGDGGPPPEFMATVAEASPTFPWALRQDSLALHAGAAPSMFGMELRSSSSLSPPLGGRALSTALPPVDEHSSLRAPPADAKRLAWRSAFLSSQRSDAVSRRSPVVPAPLVPARRRSAVFAGRPASTAALLTSVVSQQAGGASGAHWPQIEGKSSFSEKASSTISQPSPRSSLCTFRSTSTFTTSSSTTSTTLSWADGLECSEEGLIRRAASAFVKAHMRSATPFFERSQSAGNAHGAPGWKGQALKRADARSAFPPRKLAAHAPEFSRMSSDPAVYVSRALEVLSTS